MLLLGPRILPKLSLFVILWSPILTSITSSNNCCRTGIHYKSLRSEEADSANVQQNSDNPFNPIMFINTVIACCTLNEAGSTIL